MPIWDNFVSCVFPKLGIHIQIWEQEDILAQTLKKRKGVDKFRITEKF